MPKVAAPLTDKHIQALKKKPGTHAVGGSVAGLYFQVTPSRSDPASPNSTSWILRRTVANGARIKHGLGAYPEVTLSAARIAALAIAGQIAAGANPVEEQRKVRRSAAARALTAVTFQKAAEAFIAAHRAGWTNPKHAQQWENSLQTYAYPKLGSMLVEDITMVDVKSVLAEIWTERTETASRVRMRIEKVIASADANSHNTRQNPARWKNNLDTQFAAQSKVKKVKNQPAIPFEDTPAFITELRAMPGAGARALEFGILCASRSNEVRGARWEEFDIEAATWEIPASRMKMDKAHLVPLSREALALLAELPRLEKGERGAELVFPSAKGEPLSDATLLACLKRLNAKGDAPRWVDPKQDNAPAVPHGFRSVFKDWASEATSFPNELSEAALAHKIANAVEGAYRRGSLLQRRRELMECWGRFCSGRPAEIVKLANIAAA